MELTNMFVVNYEKNMGLEHDSKMFRMLKNALQFYEQQSKLGYTCILSDTDAK